MNRAISVVFFSTVKGDAYKAPQLEKLIPRLYHRKLLYRCYGIKVHHVQSDEPYYILSRIPIYVEYILRIGLKYIPIPKYYAYLIAQESLGWIFSKKVARDTSDIVFCKERPFSIIKHAKKYGKKVVIEFSEMHPKFSQEAMLESYNKYKIKSHYIYNNNFYVKQAIKSIDLADKIIVLSKESKNNFIKYGVNEKKIVVINLGLKKKFNNKFEFNKINAYICTANHSFVKGTHNLLTAWKKADIDNMPLILIGDIHDDINEFIKKHGPFKNVIFAGQQNIKKFYSQYNGIGMLVSLSEGYGRSVVEYLGNGFPVIVTPCATCDIVKHGENGFIVDYDDIDGIVKYLKKFSDNPELIELMGKKAISSVIHQDLEGYANNVIETLLTIDI